MLAATSDTWAWGRVQTFMQRTCGVALADDQAYLLECRLSSLVSETGLASIGDLVRAACLPGPPTPLGERVIDALTTHESYFFRDVTFWRALEEMVIPRLLQAGRRELRIWSMGCSHGQEPYSIAMLLEERWPALAQASTILATDVSAAAVQRARHGVYSVLEANRGLGAVRLLRHFERSREGGFAVKPALRARINWGIANLLDLGPTASRYDVVLCRNVLIYLGEPARQAVLGKLAGVTALGGFIGLGASELALGSPLAPGWFENP